MGPFLWITKWVPSEAPFRVVVVRVMGRDSEERYKDAELERTRRKRERGWTCKWPLEPREGKEMPSF